MYRPPIDMLITDIQHQIAQQQDEEVYKAVVSVGINVDKEELLRALRYDRDQYEKGFADGKADALRWIPVTERLPEMRDDGFADAFLVTDGSLAHIAYFVDGNWIFTDNGQMKEPMFYDVTHWQYLPQPPKGG